MFKGYRANLAFSNLKFTLKDGIKASKFRCLCVSFFVLLGLLTGIFLAIKSNSLGKLEFLCEFALGSFEDGTIGSVGVFFTRLFSLIFVLLILTLCAKFKFLCILGYALISYRAYLFGINFVMLLLLYGLSGIFIAIFVVLPCQLLSLLAFSIYYILSCKNYREIKLCGAPKNQTLGILLAFLLVLFLINLLEVVLLLIFRANLILVI